jgi:hypothetical protein
MTTKQKWILPIIMNVISLVILFFLSPLNIFTGLLLVLILSGLCGLSLVVNAVLISQKKLNLNSVFDVIMIILALLPIFSLIYLIF